jgi:hypothetical protein
LNDATALSVRNVSLAAWTDEDRLAEVSRLKKDGTDTVDVISDGCELFENPVDGIVRHRSQL